MASKLTLDKIAIEIAADADVTQDVAKAVARCIFNSITENISGGHEVNVPGFGKFRAKHRAARMGRNPKTGEDMEIAAKTVPNFLPAKALKEAVDE